MRADIDGRNVLSVLNQQLSLTQDYYENELAHWQGRLAELSRRPELRDRAVVCAFEGSDAAGKGGAIRRVCTALDARLYQVVPIAAPTEEERAQPHLWRFWRHLPRHGHITLFDRTWYGRVLVERVEGFCAERDWLRAYTEINDFEHELAESGVIVPYQDWSNVAKAISETSGPPASLLPKPISFPSFSVGKKGSSVHELVGFTVS